jgi:AcrR family transcriptional regulator
VPANPKANRGPSAGPDNRRALIAAAREVFAESGFSAPLSSVAKRAGVGQGSLYRHFPDRIALAVAVFDDNLGELETAAAHPEFSLDALFGALEQQAIGATALIDTIVSDREDERAEHLGARLNVVIDAVLEREKAAGRVASHVETADVMLAVSMLAFALSRAEPAARPDVVARAHAMFRVAFASHP